MPRMQQIIETLEAERAELLERVVWLELKIEEFREEQASAAAAEAARPVPAPAPKRAVRRGTAVRASNRRHAARDLRVDLGEKIIAFLADHPSSTAGTVAKALNADRTQIAGRLATMTKAGEIVKVKKGYATKREVAS